MTDDGPVDVAGTRASLFEQMRTDDPRGRESAWGTFRDRYVPVIAAFARRCGAAGADVDDIVQDVLTGFVSASGRFEYDAAKGRFRGWLKTATVRAAVRRAGRNLRYRGVPLDRVPDVELAVEPLWADVWEQQLVARALAELRAASGESVAFRAFERYVLLDRPAEAVAAELGTSVDNVHQAKVRVTRRLRNAVDRIRAADDAEGAG